MDSDAGIKLDETTTSFLAFARGLVLKLRQWEEEAGPPLYDDVEVKFVEQGGKAHSAGIGRHGQGGIVEGLRGTRGQKIRQPRKCDGGKIDCPREQPQLLS